MILGRLIKSSIRQLLLKAGYRVEPLHGRRLTIENLVWEKLKDLEQIVFLQVGANDGVKNDPLSVLRKNKGWRGVLVEANPKVFPALQQNLAAETNMIPVNVAVAAASGQTEFTVITEPEKTKQPDWADQVSSLSREFVVNTLVEWGHAATEAEGMVTTHTVPCETFADLIARHQLQALDVLFLDVEGMDFKLLKQFPFETVKPRFVLFESVHMSKEERKELPLFLAERGYLGTQLDIDVFCERWE